MIFRDLADAIGHTPLVELPRFSPRPGVRIFAKLEGANPTGSVKDRIARQMLDAAVRDGLMTPDKILLEPTSGNTGIGLAMLCQIRGFRMKAVMPESVSPERRTLLELWRGGRADRRHQRLKRKYRPRDRAFERPPLLHAVPVR